MEFSSEYLGCGDTPEQRQQRAAYKIWVEYYYIVRNSNSQAFMDTKRRIKFLQIPDKVSDWAKSEALRLTDKGLSSEFKRVVNSE